MRPQGARSWTNTTSADQLAVDLATTYGAVEGAIYHIDLSWVGQTIGDRITLWASTTAGGSVIIWQYVVMTTVGTISPNLPSVGLRFEKGIWFDPNISDTTANKVKINIGWDVRN